MSKITINHSQCNFPKLASVPEGARTSVSKGNFFQKLFNRAFDIEFEDGTKARVNEASLIKCISQHHGWSDSPKSIGYRKVAEVVKQLKQNKSPKPKDLEAYISEVSNVLMEEKKRSQPAFRNAIFSFSEDIIKGETPSAKSPHFQTMKSLVADSAWATEEDRMAIDRMEERFSDPAAKPLDFVGLLTDIDFPQDGLFGNGRFSVLVFSPLQLGVAVERLGESLSKWLENSENTESLAEEGAFRLAGEDSKITPVLNNLFSDAPNESYGFQSLERNDALKLIKWMSKLLSNGATHPTGCGIADLQFSDWSEIYRTIRKHENYNPEDKTFYSPTPHIPIDVAGVDLTGFHSVASNLMQTTLQAQLQSKIPDQKKLSPDNLANVSSAVIVALEVIEEKLCPKSFSDLHIARAEEVVRVTKEIGCPEIGDPVAKCLKAKPDDLEALKELTHLAFETLWEYQPKKDIEVHFHTGKASPSKATTSKTPVAVNPHRAPVPTPPEEETTPLPTDTKNESTNPSPQEVPTEDAPPLSQPPSGDKTTIPEVIEPKEQLAPSSSLPQEKVADPLPEKTSKEREAIVLERFHRINKAEGYKDIDFLGEEAKQGEIRVPWPTRKKKKRNLLVFFDEQQLKDAEEEYSESKTEARVNNPVLRRKKLDFLSRILEKRMELLESLGAESFPKLLAIQTQCSEYTVEGSIEEIVERIEQFSKDQLIELAKGKELDDILEDPKLSFIEKANKLRPL